MNDQQSNFGFIILGSFLTFIAMIVVELIKTYFEKKDKTSNFKLITRLELLAIRKSLEKLKTVFEYRNYFEYVIINEINKSINALELKRHESIYLSVKETQEKLINLIGSLSRFASNIRSVQDFYYEQEKLLLEDKLSPAKIKSGKIRRISVFSSDKENLDSFEKKSTQLFIDLVEINREIDEMTVKLK